MKLLLIFPPQWTPVSPHFAIPSLMGQLKARDFDVEALDLNIDFYNTVLTREYIEKSINLALGEYKPLLGEISKVFSRDKKMSDYSEEMQNKIIKYHEIKKIKETCASQLEEIPKYVDSAREALKDKELFYHPETLIKSVNLIDQALNFASMPYYPSKLSIDNYSHPLFKLDYNSIKYYVFDKNTNMFLEYFNEVFSEIENKKADLIAVSINSSSQIVPGLTLSNMLKSRLNVHVNIGGNFFGRVTEKLLDVPEFFEIFADSLSVEEGEGPIVTLAEFANGTRAIEDVSNLMYLKDGVVRINEKMRPLKLDDIAPVCLDGYKTDKYFIPEITLPFQSSRGCYWGKCSFCDQDFGQNFNVKNVEKAIAELRLYKEKYDISNFEFIDESVSPKYMELFAEKIISENLDISYFCDARLETMFSKQILEKAAKSGLKMVLWGVESGSDKIMKLINKGIDLDKRFEILKDASDCGIWNFAFIFFGFPAETREDALKTIEMLKSHKEVIHSYGRSVFSMGKHAKLAQAPEKYGITKIIPAEFDFSPTIEFESVGMTKQELHEVLQLCKNECNEAYGNPLWMYLRYREWLFLYVKKFGIEKVINYKLKF